MWLKIKTNGWLFLRGTVKIVAPILKQSLALTLENKINERLDKI